MSLVLRYNIENINKLKKIKNNLYIIAENKLYTMNLNENKTDVNEYEVNK